MPGVICLYKNEKEKALEFFLKADGIENEVFEVLFQVGRLYMEKGELEKRHSVFEKSVSPQAQFLGCFPVFGRRLRIGGHDAKCHRRLQKSRPDKSL